MSEKGEKISGVLSLDRLGAKGMFLGMLVAFLAAEIYCWATKKGWQIKMPDSVPPAVAKSFAALITAVFNLYKFLFVKDGLTGFLNSTDN